MSKAILLKGAVANVLARSAGLVASFLNVFLLGRLFNASEFGLWAWLFSIFILVTSQDFGYISAMRVQIGGTLKSETPSEQKILYGTAFLMTLAVVASAFVGVTVYSLIWNESSSDPLLRNLAILCSVTTILGTVSAQALLANLHTAMIALIEAARSIIQILIFTLAYFFNWDLKILVFCFFFTSILYVPLVGKIYVMTTGWGFKEILLTVKGNLQKVRVTAVKLLQDGWILWITQIGMTMLISSDVYLSGFFLGDEDIAKVNVVTRFQLLGVGILGAALTPIIAHFVVQVGDVSKKNAQNKILLGYFFFFFIGLFYALIFTTWGQTLAQLWSHVDVNKPLVFAYSGVLFFLMLSVTLMQIFLQFSVISKALAPWLALLIAIKIGLSQYLVSNYGYIGIFMASIFVIAFFLVVSYSLLFKQGLYERLHATR